MDLQTAEFIAQHMKKKMRERGKDLEELLSEYEETMSAEYCDRLRMVLKEAEEALKCPIQDYEKT